MMRWVVRSLCVFLAATITSSASSQDAKIGLFEGSVDIGEPGIAGSVVVDATTGRIAVKGGGENMWFARDELHLAWKKVSGNVSLSASIRFPEAGGDPHRKAVVMIRESLDTGSVYADAAIHGDGLCSLQYRDTTDGATHEVQALQKSPQRLSLERRGEFLIMLVGESASDMQIAGSICLRELKEPFYVGLGVCANNDARIETAEFSDVAFHGEL